MIFEMYENFYYKDKMQENKENGAVNYFSREDEVFYLISDRIRLVYMRHSADLPLLIPIDSYDEDGIIHWEP